MNDSPPPQPHGPATRTDSNHPTQDPATSPRTGVIAWARQNLDCAIVLGFFAVRLLINIEAKLLMAFFAISYALFIIMLLRKTAFFSTLVILFLIVDSMIGTYLATRAGHFGVDFWGTMAINLLIAALITRNVHHTFPH